MDKSQFLPAFLEECEENLQAMESGALRLEADPGDRECLNTVFRAAHSIKGGASVFDMPGVSAMSHALEGMLDLMRKGGLAVTGARVGLILEVADCLKRLLAAERGNGAVDPDQVASVLRRLDSDRESLPSRPASLPDPVLVSPADDPFSSRFRVSYHPNPLCLSRGEDPLAALTKLSRQFSAASMKVRCDDLPPLNRLSPDICYLWWEMEGTSVLPGDLLLRNLAGVVGGGIEVRISSLMSPDAGVSSEPLPLTDRPPSLLGSILLEDRLVSERQLTDALSRQAEGVRLGDALVSEGVISNDQLAVALQKQRTASRLREISSVRVDAEKLDRLVNLTGELAITRTLLGQISNSPGFPDLPGLKDTVDSLERHARNLQETAMSIRMLPVGNVFNRFPRLVRDLAAASDKKVALVITGESTELDKSIIEKLGDPLTHLIRNAVDHGIETPETRRALGKPASATVKLRAFEEGGSVVISVEDDGRGLDREAILKKALSGGLLDSAARASEMPDQQVYSMIFEPGFSTAEQVTDVSGRGVGMDVVKKQIDALGGAVGIFTRPGAFTRFVLRLPLNLAIMEGQLVRVGDERYVIPLISIVESLRPQASDVQRIQGNDEVLFWREEYLQILRLYEILDGSAWEMEPANALVVVVEHDGKRKALLVDDLLEQQQMVVKGLGGTLAHTPGIAGATILGDGKVALILDVSTLEKPAHLR